MGHLLQWILLSIVAGASITSGCPGDRPMKQLICRQTGPLHDKFDPCLCTHLVLHKDLHHITSGEAKKAVIDYKAINPSLQVLGSWSPDAELDLDGPQLAKRANSLELDGIFLESSTDSAGPSAKDKILNLVKVLATELDSYRSSKRANDKYQHVEKKSLSDRNQDSGIIVQLPSHPQALGKHYDLKKLSKYVDYYVMATDNITDISENGLSYHPSRLMGIDDVLNADSLIDLVSGLGAPHEKLILTLPSSAFTFTLAYPEENMPRSKVTGQPKKISQAKLCSIMEEGGWTVERDEDLTAPYAYRNKSWVAFDDSTSAAIKGKYILLRDLAGAAMDSIQMEDWEGKCKETEGSVIKTLYETFTTIARKPRAAQLLALQEQIHDAYNIPFSDVQLSPYRIIRVVDRAGSIHVVRKEAKTEFTCSRQGYFTHPSGCNRFYRCVKFNQYSSEFTVFEYDCPAGLAFDERYEVCVWPGSLPDANACKGSSEIAPVPRTRFACPAVEGYYADPENCRWFFACLDHRRDGSELTAYEFRCPFGLVFNEKNLVCDWPWYVDGCGNGAGISTISSGFTAGDILEGRLRPSYAQIPDVQVSGGRIENVNGGYVLGSSLGSGLQGIKGYRAESSNINAGHLGIHGNIASANVYSGVGGFGLSKEQIDNSGAYVHDPTGDHGGDYIHQEGPGSAYVDNINGGGAYVGAVGSGAYIHDSTGEHGGDYVHQGGPGSAYVAGVNKGATYVGLKTTPGLGIAVGQANIDNSGAYLHQSTGDQGGQYVHQEGPGSTYVTGINGGASYSGSTVGLKTTPGLGIAVGQANIDSSGAYIHDSTGDHGGDYVHQDGPGSAYVAGINKGATYVGSTVGLKTTPGLGIAVGQANVDNSGAYLHQSTGDQGGHYVHQEGPGSAYVEGINRGASYSGSTVGLKTTSGLGIAVGQANIDNSGAYVHDTTGDYGGDYIHQDGPGSAYVAGINKGAAYVGSTVGLKTNPGLGIAVGQAVVDNDALIQNRPLTQGINTVTFGQKSVPLAPVELVSQTIDNSGQYVHNTDGDNGGTYLHQDVRDGGYTHVSGGLGNSGAYVHGVTSSGEGGYVQQGGNINIYRGSTIGGKGVGGAVSQGGLSYTSFSSGSGSGSNLRTNINVNNDGQYIHDTTGDHGGDYIHQEGPQGPQGPGYIHDNRANYVAGLYSAHAVNQGNYYANGYENYNNKYNLKSYNLLSRGQAGQGGAYVHDNSGQYIHDNSGDYVHTVTGSYVPALYSSGGYAAGAQGHYAGGYGDYLKQDGAYAPVNVYSTTFTKPRVGTYPSKYFTNVQPVSLEGIGGAAFTNVQPSTIHSNIGIINQPVTAQPHYHVTTPRPLTYHSTVHVPVSSTLDAEHNIYVNQPTATVRPIVVSSTPSIPLSPVQYATVTQKPLVSLSQVKPVLKYSISTPSVPVVSHSYKQPVNTFTITGTPTVPVVPVTTPLPPVSRVNVYDDRLSQTFIPSSVSYTQPQNVVQPLSVLKTPVVPLNPVQYVKPAVLSTPAPAVVSSYYQPSIKTQEHVSYVQQPVVNTYQQPTVIRTNYHTVSTPAPPVASYTFGTKLQPAQVVHSVFEHHHGVSSTPSTPIEPVRFVHTVKPIVISTPAPFRTHSESVSVANSPVVPLNRVQNVQQVVSSPAPPVVSYSYKSPSFVHSKLDVPSYSYQQPILKTDYVQPFTVSTTPSIPLNPIQYVKPAQVPVAYQKPISFVNTYEHRKPIDISYTQYQQPIVETKFVEQNPQKVNFVTTPAPSIYQNVDSVRQCVNCVSPSLNIKYEKEFVQPISVSTTPIVPLAPVQYVNKPSFSYSYQQPIRPVSTYDQKQEIYKSYIPNREYVSPLPTVVSTVAPPSYVYKDQKPLRPFTTFEEQRNVFKYSKKPFAGPSYLPPATTIVSSTPSPPIISYSYDQEPIAYPKQTFGSKVVLPPATIVSSTPATPVVSYSYEQQPIAVAKPSYNKVVLPPATIVSSTPAPPVVSYSYEQQPIAYPKQTFGSKLVLPPATIVSSTPASPVVSYSYEKESIAYPKQTFGSKVVLPPATIVSSTPAAPVYSYSYEQQPIAVAKQTYGSKVVLPPVAPIVSSSPTPVFSYSYEQAPILKTEYEKPIGLSNAPYIPLNVNGTVLYGRPVPVRGCTVCSSVSENQGSANNVNTFGQYESGYNSYSYQQAPIKTGYEFQSGAFVQTVQKPSVPLYQYQQPAYQVPVAKQENVPAKPCSTCYNSQSAAISVSSTPVVPLNTVQYVTTPAPIIKQTPLVPLKVAQPVVTQYHYQKPLVSVQDQHIIKETIRTPIRPVINYNYQKIQPITVSTTPIVPLNRVQYVTKTTPYVISTTSTPVTYTDSHLYEINKFTSSQTPVAPVISNRPVTVTSTVRPATYEVYNRQPSIVYNPTRLSTPTPFRTQYKEDREYTATVSQSPINLDFVKGNPTPVFEEYFGYNKNELPSVSQYDINSRYEGEVRFPSTTYTTVAPTLKTVNYETRVPVHQYQTTVTPTTPDVKYTVTYKQPTTVVSEPVNHVFTYDNIDETLNAHIDLAKVNLDVRNQYFIPTSTAIPSTTGSVNTGGYGYYQPKLKVKVRPVVSTTTQNYPSVVTSTKKPVVYSSTVDLTSPTFYTTTVRPIITSSFSSAELDIDTSDEDQKLVDEVSGNFGEVINVGNQGIIEQKYQSFSGLSSTTISSLKDGEAIVGVIKKTRVSSDGRKKSKVVVVSRLSDFNPILVGKLGAQCSCQTDGQPETQRRRVTVKRIKGRLFTPQTSTVDYLSSTTALPDSYASEELNSYEYQEPVVEIKPLRKVQRIYSTTSAPLDVGFAASVDSGYLSQAPVRGRTVGRKQTLKYEMKSEVNSIETEAKIVTTAIPAGDTVDLVRGTIECQRAGLFRHPKQCNKFYSCNWDPWKKKFTLSVFNCPIHLAYDSNLGACNWPSKGPACSDDNLLV